MSEKDKRFIVYWNDKKQGGRLKFAVFHGILFGAIVFILVTGISYLTGDILATRNELLLNLGFLILGGMFYEGGYTWWMNSRRYKKLTQNQN